MNNKRSNSFNIPIFIRRSSLFKYITYKRRKVVDSKTTSLGSSSEKKNGRNIQPRGIKSSVKVFILFVLAILVALFIISFVKYLNFNPVKFFESDTFDSTQVNNKRELLLIVGFDDRVPEYKFADLIVLVDRDLSARLARLYILNPMFSSSSDASLRSYMNRLDDNKVEGFIDKIESLVGMNINNYIFFNKSDLKGLFNDLEETITTNRSYVLESDTIFEGETIELLKAIDYSIGFTEFSDDNLYFNQILTSSILKRIANKSSLFNWFIEPSDFLNTFRTSYSRDELFELLINLDGYNIVFSKDMVMSTSLGSPSSSDVIIPIYSRLDDNIQSNFSNFNVVKEQVQIEIYNATNESGIASKYQRLIKNQGGIVIKIGNSPEPSRVSRVYFNLKNISNYANTIELISNLLGNDVRMLDISEYKYNYAGEIIIILGDESVSD